MKRLLLSLAAVAAVAGPIAGTATAAYADSRRDDRWERRAERSERQWERERDRRERQWERDRDRADRQRDRDRRQWERQVDRWDRSRHNGYYYHNRWHYGPPPAAYYSDPYFRPGYTAWRRGATLPSYYRGAQLYEYDRYRLRRPPPGYAWYRVNDDYVLTQMMSGLIMEVVGGY
jgi:Ni/Co efflux regulator RcnB